MSKTQNSTNLKSWLQWKQKCALDLCLPEKQRDLGTWGRGKFRKVLRDKAPDFCMPDDQTLPDHKGAGSARPRWNDWHLFEYYMHATSKTTGKRWKDWLFEKAEREAREAVMDKTQEKLRKAFTDKLEANACTCITTTVVNRLLTDESDWKEKKDDITLVSGNAPVNESQDAGTSFSLFDLLAQSNPEETPENQLALKQLEKLAASLARKYFENLSRRARVGLAFSAEGFSLNNPAIVAAAGCTSVQRIYEAINIEEPGKKRAAEMEKRGESKKVLLLKKLGDMKRAGELQRMDGSRIIMELAEEISKGPYKNEDRRSLKRLVMECFLATVKLCVNWARKDAPCAIIFKNSRKL